jgi:hypothetical protein
VRASLQADLDAAQTAATQADEDAAAARQEAEDAAGDTERAQAEAEAARAEAEAAEARATIATDCAKAFVAAFGGLFEEEEEGEDDLEAVRTELASIVEDCQSEPAR